MPGSHPRPQGREWHDYRLYSGMGLSKRSSTVSPAVYQELISPVVPPQQTGGQSNVNIGKVCSGTLMADEVYRSLKLLLLDVNNWHRYVPGITAHFHLTDKNGRIIQRQAALGDHFKIRIPGPKLKLGGGFDWTTVKSKEETSNGIAEMFHVTAVPSCNPTGDEHEVAHFLKDAASTTFIALKEGRSVRLLILSRNETANTSVPGLYDRIRNGTVGFFAGLYFSRFQWSKLARSLMRAGIRNARTSDRSFAIN